MKILVTGAHGMVGRNLLADPRAGAHVILAPTRAELDLTDRDATLAFLARERPDLVVHLAAVVGGIQANIDGQARFLADNLAISLNLLSAARRVGTPRLINLASSCMYPAGAPNPLREESLLGGPLEPTNEGYALAKIAAWKLATLLSRDAPSLAWRTVIAPNLYGPFDRFDPVRSHLVPAAILKLDAARREGLGAVEIWGDGTARRELMFAPDLADFLWRFHDRLEDLPDPINVGVGADLSVTEVYQAAAAAMGFKGAFTHDPAKPTGMREKRLDVGAQTRLGWRPATPLAAGLAATVAYYRALPIP